MSGKNISLTYVLCLMTWLYMSQAIPHPGPPQHLSVVSDVTNIGVQWEPPTETYGNIRNYIVSWTILPNVTELTNIVGGDVTMSIISVHDQLGRLFRIRVRAENEGGIGPYSFPKYTRIACGNDYDLFPGRNVTTTSPGFYTGAHIKPGILCSWTFKTLANYSLEVYFDELKLTQNNSYNCLDTYIDISGIGRVCDKTETGNSKRTSLQKLQIALNSGLKAGGRGFRIAVKSVVLLPGPPTQIAVRTFDHAIIISWQPPREKTLPITAYRIRYVVTHSQQYLITVGQNMRQFPINTDSFEGKVITIQLSALIGTDEGEKSQTYFARAPCRRRIHLNGTNSVNITSPGYPRAYPSNVICTWFITSEVNVTSLITYIDFRLEDTSFCSSDFVTFSFRDTLEHECSRMVLPKTFETNTQNYTLTFVTDGRNEFAGFLIRIRSKAMPQGIDEATIVSTKAGFISDDGGKVMPSTQANSVSTSHKLMTSSVTEDEINLSSAKSLSHTTEKSTVALMTTARKLFTHNNPQNKFAQNRSSTPDMRTVSLQYETLYDDSTTREMSTYNERPSAVENASYDYAMEYSASFLNFSSSTISQYSFEKGSEDNDDNGIVLAVVLSTVACTILLLISVCYFRWRHRHGQMKINIEPTGKYRVTNIELHDIMRPQQLGYHHSRPCLHVSRESVFATRNLETISEYPEDSLNGKKKKKTERKRRYSFPFCFSTRRRKIQSEIQNSLNTFGFIEDKQSLERTLKRKYCLRRTNSL